MRAQSRDRSFHNKVFHVLESQSPGRPPTTRRLNVLIVVDKFDYHGSYMNGPARYFSTLVPRLNGQRFNVSVVVLRSKGQSDILFERENIQVTYLGLGKYNPLTLYYLIKLIRDRDIDVVHLTGYGSTTFGRLAAAICGKPAIIQEHWVDPNFGGPHRVLEKCLGMVTAKAIAISDYAADFLITKKGIPKDRVVLIRNGIPLEKFRNGDERAGTLKRHEWGIPGDAILVGIVGMLHKNKGHRYFIEAASLVRPEKPGTRFLVIGEGEMRAELDRLVSDLALEKDVMFLGHQEDIPSVLQTLDIFVLTSISEAAGLSLLEAMAAGKAIITTDSGGPGEIIQNGITGLVVPVGDSRAIADNILYLIDNPVQRRYYGERARKESDQYDISSTVRKIEDTYEEVAFGSSRSHPHG